MHKFTFGVVTAAVLAVAACETGGTPYDSVPPEALTWESSFCDAGALSSYALPHGAMVVSVTAHYATGFTPWSAWNQTSAGIDFTCPAELLGGQGNVVIYYLPQ